MKIFFAYYDDGKWFLTKEKPNRAHVVIHATSEYDAQMQVFEMMTT